MLTVSLRIKFAEGVLDLNDQTGPDGKLLVEKLIELGGRSSNAQLRAKTRWNRDKYFAVRNQCRAAGLVGVERGRGGIVVLIDGGAAGLGQSKTTSAEEKAGADEVAKEAEYYERLMPTIKQDWVEGEGFDDAIVEVTATRRVKGAGRWTVPDIVVIGKRVYQYVPGFEFTVHSMEVKRFEALDALAVFEALNHRRASHFTFLVVVNHPARPTRADQEKLGQIQQLCEEHDVGLVIINKGDEDNYDEWEFLVESRDRSEPEPYNLDGFIKQYLTSESRDTVAKMVR